MSIVNEFVAIIANDSSEFVCAYGKGPEELKQRVVIKATNPDDVMQEVVQYVESVKKKAHIAAIGAGVFGPIDIDRNSVTYGYITSATNPMWTYFDFVGVLSRELKLPVCFDTAVNAAAMGEYRWGAADGLTDFIYMSVGQSVGVGAVVNNKLLRGLMHPEMGHILIPQNRRKDLYTGNCPFHRNCLQGLTSSSAMQERWGVDSIDDLPEEHPAWDLQMHYIGIALANYTMTLSPTRIIMDGHMMRFPRLLFRAQATMIKHLNGCMVHPKIMQCVGDYVVLSQLAQNAGICGALALAEKGYLENYVGLKQEFVHDD